jgi:hypothetical protein
VGACVVTGGADVAGGGATGGALHADSPTQSAVTMPPAPGCLRRTRENRSMWLFVIEALVALMLLVFIVWWTMFSGRDRGERRDEDPPPR